MTQKFYLHRGASSVSGTLPPTTDDDAGYQGLMSLTYVATGASTNRTMDGTASAVAQTSITGTTGSATAGQRGWFLRFLSEPIAAQTITTPTISVSIGALESNTNANAFSTASVHVGIWRPGDGSLVGRWTVGGANEIITLNEPGTAQTHCTGSATAANSLTSQAGDVLLLEVVSNATQGMSAAYNITVHYDGTTESSTTNIAAYLDMGVNITMDSAPPPTRVPRFSPYPQLLAR